MKIKNLLNLASILNIIGGIFHLLFSNYILALILIVLGFVYKGILNQGELKKNKIVLLILGIFNIFFNIFSAICVFISFDKINLEPIQEESNNKNKKIDFLLQLGVVLIVISGLMIATNNNINLPNIFKIICLVFLTLIFFALSYFSKNYLKINNSYKAYYLLGNTFIALIYIALSYYNLLGPISLNGPNSSYFYPILFYLIGILIINLKRIFNKSYIIDLSIASFFLGTFTLFNALELNIIINLLLMSVIVALMNSLVTTTSNITASMHKVGYYFSLILAPISIYYLASEPFSNYSLILAIIVNLNIFFIYLLKKDYVSSILSPLILISNSIIVVVKNSTVPEINVIFISAIISLFYLIIKLIKIDDNKVFKITYLIAFNLTLIITGITSFFTTSFASIITTSIILIPNLLLIYLDKNKKIELFLEPIKSLLFIISLVIFLNNKLNVDILLNVMIITLTELILYLAIPNKKLKLIHFIMYLTMSCITSLIALNSTEILLVTMASIFALFPLIICEVKRDQNYLPSYIISGIFTLIITKNDIFANYYYFNFIFLIPLTLFLTWINRNDKIKRNILLILTIALIFTLIGNLNLSYDVYVGLRTCIYSLIGLLIAINIPQKEAKDIFTAIYFSLIILINLLFGGFVTGLIIGIITLSLIILASILDFKKIKITGIILFILNLLYQLKDYWNKIPLAIYLLIVGLILIGIVIYKELKSNK